MHRAISRFDSEEVARLVLHPSAHQPNEDGDYPEHVAAALRADEDDVEMQGHITSIMHALYSSDVYVGTRTNAVGWTALDIALDVDLGDVAHLDVIRVLATPEALRRAQVPLDDDQVEGMTPMHVAARNGSAEVVSLFMGILPEATLIRDSCGSTPLHVAAYLGTASCVGELLRDRRAVCAKDNFRRSALAIAALRASDIWGDIEQELEYSYSSWQDAREEIEASDMADIVNMLHMLVDATCAEAPQEIVRMCKGSSRRLSMQYIHPLCIAALVGDEQLFDAILVRHPSALDAVTATGGHALHFACQTNQAAIAKKILDLDPSALDAQYGDDLLETPVHVAAMMGAMQVLEVLVEYDAGVLEMVDGQDVTPLMKAIEGRHVDAAEFIAARAPHTASAMDEVQESALWYAVTHGDENKERFVSLILDLAPAITWETNDRDQTILHTVVGMGMADIFRMLYR